MGRKPLISKYVPFINQVRADLDISELVIQWKWTYDKDASFSGNCSWPMWLTENEKYHIITLKRTYYNSRKLYATIAHELRHVWQMKNNLLEYKHGIVWNGSAPHSYHKSDKNFVRHSERPEELDANEYARTAMIKFDQYTVRRSK